jgi:hypothetical protein
VRIHRERGTSLKIRIEVEEGNHVVAVAECDASAEESVDSLASRVATQLEATPEELLLDLGTDAHAFKPGDKVGDCLRHGDRWRHRRTRIDLHFESEEATHRFPAISRWGRVHLWGCDKFHVPKDVCANLELREGSPTGPALNENKEIGTHHGCEVVWLVKPGPEPFGRK